MPSDESSEKSHVMEQFGENVQRLLSSRGLSQADLARALNEHPTNVYNWLNQKARPNAEVVFQIGAFLNVPIDALYGRIPEGRHALIYHSEEVLRLAKELKAPSDRSAPGHSTPRPRSRRK